MYRKHQVGVTCAKKKRKNGDVLLLQFSNRYVYNMSKYIPPLRNFCKDHDMLFCLFLYPFLSSKYKS